MRKIDINTDTGEERRRMEPKRRFRHCICEKRCIANTFNRVARIMDACRVCTLSYKRFERNVRSDQQTDSLQDSFACRLQTRMNTKFI